MSNKGLFLILLWLPVLLAHGGPMDEIDSLQTILPKKEGVEKVHTLISLSETYRSVVFNDCLKYGQKALQLANKLGQPDLEALALKSMGNSCYFSGELDLAKSFYRRGLAKYKENNDLQGQANCLNNIGLIFEELSAFDSAGYFYQKSLEKEEEIGNKSGMAVSLLQLGNVYYYRDELQQSLDNYYRAMLIFKEENDSLYLAGSYNSLGVIYREWNQFDKALDYYLQAMPIFNKLNDNRNLSFVLTNLGEIYNFELKDYKKALTYYEESLKLKKKLNDQIGIALLYNNLGTLYANMEDSGKALSFFNKSRQLYEDFEGETGLVMVLYNIGALYLDLQHYEKAIGFLTRSLNMAEEYGYTEYISLNQEALMHCYAANGDYTHYEEYFRLYSLSKDSLIDKLYQLQSEETEIKYRIEETLAEAKSLQQANANQESQIRKYKLYLAAISAFIILVIIAYALFSKIKKQP